MMSTLIAVLALLSALCEIQVAAKNGGLSWTIYHSWNSNQEFVRRGSLIWGHKTSSDDTKDATSDKKEFQIINDDASSNLTSKEIREMLEYGWYHVKIEGDSTGDNNFVFQTVPACNLRRANFKDLFEITLPRSSLGNRQDPMTSFSYTPLVSPLAPKTCDKYDNDGDDGDAAKNTRSFSSRVSVQLDTPAMVLKNILPPSKPPPGIMLVKQPKQPGNGQQGSGAGDEENEDDDTPPNPIPSPLGLLQRYWYIILPIMILQFITVPEEEVAATQGPQQQGGNKGSGGTIAAPAAASSQKGRRGKTSKRN